MSAHYPTNLLQHVQAPVSSASLVTVSPTHRPSPFAHNNYAASEARRAQRFDEGLQRTREEVPAEKVS